MPQFRVIVPPGVKEGQLVRAYVGGRVLPQPNNNNLRGGTDCYPNNPPTITVRVPKGAAEGDAFIFEVSQQQLDQQLKNSAAANAAAAAAAALQVSGKKNDNKNKSAAGGADNGSSLTNNNNIVVTPAPVPVTNSRLVHAYYNGNFCPEICLGFLIGMSMVFGFFAGVLYVTDPL